MNLDMIEISPPTTITAVIIGIFKIPYFSKRTIVIPMTKWAI